MNTFEKWFTEIFVNKDGVFIEGCMFCVLRGNFPNTDAEIDFSKIQEIFSEEKKLPSLRYCKETFLYQMTEQLLLAGIHPKELVSHPKNKQFRYDPARGLVFNMDNRCDGFGARVVLEIVDEILSNRTP